MIIRIVWFRRLLLIAFGFSLPVFGQEQGSDRQSDELSVGAYYYPWYRAAEAGETGWMSRALRGRLEPQQLPKLGVYGSRDPKVIGDHIAQSVQAGLDFWAVSWWGPGKRDDRTLRDHILTHPDAGKLKYAILYESTGRLGSMLEPHYENLIDDFAYMKETVFDHPAYLKIDGKPVVFIYLTRVYFRDRGLEPLAQLRGKFPDLYLIGDDVFGERYDERHARLWDAVTAYDIYGQSMQRDGATQAAMDRLLGNYQNAKKVANGVGTGFIPGIAPGYNDRAVREGHTGRARTFTDKEDSKEGDVFRSMIRDVAIPLADPNANRTIMITSFNEWYEDTQIEATRGGGLTTSKDDSDTGNFYTEGDRYVDYGSLYLDILREEIEIASEAASKVAATGDNGKPLQQVRVSDDGKQFVRGTSDEKFIVWGVNYDHDSIGEGRLLDEYWEDDWETVVADFREMKELGANCVRIHLQLGQFMEAPDKPNSTALARLAKLVKLAEETRLYLDVTGLACYHKQNIPEWYDPLGEQERWAAQAVFWEAVAEVCAGSPAIFCYDLMNEPILPGKEPTKDWLAGELGGKFFVQRISLDLNGRAREEVAEAWVNKMVAAIRKQDQRQLITVGVIPWVFAFGGGKPLFHGPQVGKQLDFVAVHFYPEKGEIEKALKALKAYEVGKPLVIEEMFPLKCSEEELMEFVDRSAEHTDGWISFYWGKTAKELREKDNPSIGEAITASWLETFRAKSPGRDEAFKVIGYQPSWGGDVDGIQYDKLTHINYSFIFPKADGTFKDMPNPAMLAKLVKLAHVKNVKVGIAIGGWNGGNDRAFEELAASQETRRTFVSETMKLVKAYDLDGVDMDWEYPDAGTSSENFLSLMRELSVELRREKKYLSTAVVSLGRTGEGIKEEVFPLIDMLNIMAYDGKDHGLYSQAEASIKYWSERGCPKDKLILGLPFYGRSPYKSYRNLVEEDPKASTKDVIGEIRYNGIATMQKKTRLGMEKGGGVMIWELSQDVKGKDSLLSTVSNVIAAKPLQASP
ncbi:MAG: GH18 family chitinase [Verrucomicrobiales bacterium]|jgi:GH18 family chitinase